MANMQYFTDEINRPVDCSPDADPAMDFTRLNLVGKCMREKPEPIQLQYIIQSRTFIYVYNIYLKAAPVNHSKAKDTINRD